MFHSTCFWPIKIYNYDVGLARATAKVAVYNSKFEITTKMIERTATTTTTKTIIKTLRIHKELEENTKEIHFNL